MGGGYTFYLNMVVTLEGATWELATQKILGNSITGRGNSEFESSKLMICLRYIPERAKG